MEFTGKTVEEAVAAGLAEMGLTEENAEISVIEQPSKGLFGRVKGKAVVSITEKQKKKESKSEKTAAAGGNDTAKVAEFVQSIFDVMDITAKTEIAAENVINVIAAETSSAIGYRGEVLDAVQTLAGAFANAGRKDYVKVVVDCENYRARREETLIKLAKRLEEKATEMRREVILEPMPPFERRIIHTALSDSQTVTTKSEGKEPSRYVVIVPNDKDEFSRPYNAGRNTDRKHGGRDRRDRNSREFSRKGGRRTGGESAPKRVAPSGFGTYLGNSLKDNK